jgi:hypothetical protein
MEMKYKVFFLLISMILLSGTVLATSSTLKSASQPYYIDPQHNLWLKVNMNGSTQHFNVYNRPGYSPNGDAVMWAYDNFSSGSLNTLKWTAYKEGSNNSKVEVQNGHLVLSGSGNTSSANVVLNKPFTNGIELAVNETLTWGTHNPGTFSDVSFGSGAVVGGVRGTDWWHTHFKTGGDSFQSQGIDKAIIWVNSNSSDIQKPTPGIRLNDFVEDNVPHTVAYSYDSSGNANMYMLNVTQNRLPLSIPDPYGYNQFNHPSIYFNETGVFGHKWWMFITPYAYSRGELENACLYYSDDGLVWHVPPGVKNPIGTPIESEYEANVYGLDPYGSNPYGSDSRGCAPYGSDPYGSDPHIIYNPNIGKFMCYYVIGDIVGDETVEDTKVKTYDGITVSPEINVNSHGLSPAVLYDEATRTFYMWIVDIDPSPHVINRYTSTDGIHFGNKQAVGQSSQYHPWHMNVMKYPGKSTIYALLTMYSNNGFTGDLHIATANNYTDNFTVQNTSLLKLDDSSCPTHTDTLLYRSAGVFTDDGNILKLWIPAQDNNGVWTVFYTQATKEKGVWKVGKFTTLRAPLMTTKNTQYLYTPKQWMLSQGDSPKSHGVKREINEVWGYKTGHTPKATVKNMGTYTQIEVKPTDLQNVSDYQVMVPASMLNISSQSESLDVERV